MFLLSKEKLLTFRFIAYTLSEQIIIIVLKLFVECKQY